MQFRDILKGAETVIQRAALRIKAVSYGHGFQKGGFSRAVFSGKKSNISLERKIAEALYGRNSVKVRAVFYRVPIQMNSLNIETVHSLPPV